MTKTADALENYRDLGTTPGLTPTPLLLHPRAHEETTMDFDRMTTDEIAQWAIREIFKKGVGQTVADWANDWLIGKDRSAAYAAWAHKYACTEHERSATWVARYLLAPNDGGRGAAIACAERIRKTRNLPRRAAA